VLLLCSACVIFISILFIFWDRRVFVGLIMGDDGRGKHREENEGKSQFSIEI
jgi:hypothetical protein